MFIMKTYRKMDCIILFKKKNAKKETAKKEDYIKQFQNVPKKVQVSYNLYTCDRSRGAGNMSTHPRTMKIVVVQIA